MPFNSPAGPSTPKEKPDDERFAAMLQQLVRVLTGYPALRFTPFYYLQKHGESKESTPRRWRTVLGLEEIQYLPEDVDLADKSIALGKAAHESWHLLYSRPELIFDAPKELLESMAFQALWWSVEDPRVNVIGLRDKHPGAREWIDAAYARDYEIRDLNAERKHWAESIPLHLQFNYALIYEWWTGRRDPRISDDRVHAALDRAADAIRRAYSTADAQRSFAIVQNEIWPIYKELVDEAYEQEQKKKQKGQQGQQGQQDQQDQQGQQGQEGQESDSDSQSQSSSSSSSQKPGQQGKQGQSGKSGQQKKQKPQVSDDVKKEMEKKEKEQRDKNASQMVDSPEKMSQAEREKMKKELEELRKKMGQKDGQDQKDGKEQDGQEGQQDQQGQKGEQSGQSGKGQAEGRQMSESQRQAEAERKAKQRDRLSKADERSKELDRQDQTSYKSFYDDVRKLIPVARQQLMQVLKRRVRRRTISDRRSGDLDEDNLNQLPSGKPDPFVETMSSNKALYRISLLIDTSGSMSGDKRISAIKGAVLLMETLEKIPGVVFEIACFDNTARVLKPYNERLTPASKIAVVKALMNGSGSTQSHVAVEQAIERSRMGRGEKMIIMVNDGDPDDNFDRDQYRALVKSAKDIEIHGIGLGNDAQLVLDLFPPGQGWWLKDVAEFAKSLRSIIHKKLMGGSSR